MKRETIIDILSNITEPARMDRLLDELLTPAERKSVELRLELLKNLRDGVPQREIARQHGISLCKITRGSKILKDPDSVLSSILKR